MRLSRLASFVATLALSPLAWAGFSPLSGQEVLQQFNLVALSGGTSATHVHGRGWIGGNFVANSGAEFANDTPIPTSNYAALTVTGSLTGTQVTVNNNGSAAVGLVAGGNISTTNQSIVNNGGGAVNGNASNITFNGGKAYVGGTTTNVNFNGGRATTLASDAKLQSAYDAATSTDMKAVMSGLSNQLAALNANSTVAMSGSKAIFTAVAGADGRAVFNLNGALGTTVFGATEFEFNLGSATSFIFNTDLTSVTVGANFLGGSATGLLANAAVWNFNKATSLNVNAQFGGTILATNAAFKNTADIEGSVIVNTLNSTGNQIHLYSFTGNVGGGSNKVPEPESLALVGLALACAALARRRQRV
ncbi:choice-of-anchor A family protein [Roseateles sp.]|uniref:choice-of-anchor A family protein n=1 Tax=Roseateles sp. TaxID=1971397 RepID=UPI0039321DF1